MVSARRSLARSEQQSQGERGRSRGDGDRGGRRAEEETSAGPRAGDRQADDRGGDDQLGSDHRDHREPSALPTTFDSVSGSGSRPSGTANRAKERSGRRARRPRRSGRPRRSRAARSPRRPVPQIAEDHQAATVLVRRGREQPAGRVVIAVVRGSTGAQRARTCGERSRVSPYLDQVETQRGVLISTAGRDAMKFSR